jgi:bifunctional enzyme CysN/CysC
MARTATQSAPKSTPLERDFLRFITCGSVDDGKSTLIGRLLYDTEDLAEDQLSTLVRDSAKSGTQGENLDFALLVDGLEAEREQGITIDVAYRYFSTATRSYIVADTPGHEQYTRNMATGASTADLAIILIDARKGVLAQTLRHSVIVSMMGVKQVILAVNKMDLMGYDEALFDSIVRDFSQAAGKLQFSHVTAIPIVAIDGDNLAHPSAHMPWYKGETLLHALEAARPRTPQSLAFRFPVQWVNRPDSSFRGFAGKISSGQVAVGDEVRVVSTGQKSHIARIVTHDGDLPQAVAGQAVTLTLRDEVDISRGDVILGVNDPLQTAKGFTANLFWMSQVPLKTQRDYELKLATASVGARITHIDHRLDINTLTPMASNELAMNAVGQVQISLDSALLFTAYERDKELGSFILVDKTSQETLALGMVLDTPSAASKQVHTQGVGYVMGVGNPIHKPFKRTLILGMSVIVVGITLLVALFSHNRPISIFILAYSQLGALWLSAILYKSHKRVVETAVRHASVYENASGGGI